MIQTPWHGTVMTALVKRAKTGGVIKIDVEVIVQHAVLLRLPHLDGVERRGGLFVLGLKTWIGHAIGLHESISIQYAWAPSRAYGTARVGCGGAGKCVRMVKMVSKLTYQQDLAVVSGRLLPGRRRRRLCSRLGGRLIIVGLG